MSKPPPPLPPTDFQTPPKAAKSGIPLPLIIVIAVGVVVVGIAILAGLAAPVLLRMRKKGDLVKTHNNGKSLAMAISDFSTEYGGFPDRETAKQVIVNTGSTLSLSGDTANDYFRQLIAAGLKSEEPFWAKTAFSPHPPDNNVVGKEALKAGEVGFGYVMNGMSAIGGDDLSLPIAVTPLSNKSGVFDPRPFDGKAVFVFGDGRVEVRVIGPDGGIALSSGSGKTLLDHPANAVWGADVHPVIKAPQKK